MPPAGKKYTIDPTGGPISGNYSDIALTGLFNAHIATINSQRQVIWQRYNIMLLANAAILAFFARGQPNPYEAVAAGLLGFVLCFLWRVMHGSAWNLFNMLVDEAHGFSWSGNDKQINPLVTSVIWLRGSKGGLIYPASNFVTYIFMVTYVFFGDHRFFLHLP
jgi:hypothetical protein